MTKQIKCPECGGMMQLRSSRYGPFYGCENYPTCTCTHGAHADGKPLGTPATKETREWRIKAHDAFDTLWQEGAMKRKDAYRWMRRAMGMTPDEAHIGRFDIEQCKMLIAAVRCAHDAAEV